ncbi:MAG: hypothetical protein Ct9H90mP6_08790 [Gammaproteobacteria bacterium]|nr:MAG: hypothetical protein Ct9H90mP6_08790 [Gammaproteobacteria bacterium]
MKQRRGVQTFKKEMDLNLFKVDAQKIFLRHLKRDRRPRTEKKKLSVELSSMFLMLRLLSLRT